MARPDGGRIHRASPRGYNVSEQPTTALPEDLQARLDAAGVTDQASLAAALDADPQLKADLDAFIAHQRWSHLEAWYGAFTQTRSHEDMIALWQQVPTEWYISARSASKGVGRGNPASRNGLIHYLRGA